MLASRHNLPVQRFHGLDRLKIDGEERPAQAGFEPLHQVHEIHGMDPQSGPQQRVRLELARIQQQFFGENFDELRILHGFQH